MLPLTVFLLPAFAGDFHAQSVKDCCGLRFDYNLPEGKEKETTVITRISDGCID